MTNPRLRAQLWLNRIGTLPIAAAFLTSLALWLHFSATPHLWKEIEAYRKNLIALTSQGSELRNPDEIRIVEPSLRELRYADFRNHLINKSDLPGIIRILFTEASKNRLLLTQMDYKLGTAQTGQYRTYRLTAPIKGSYGDIRRFANSILDKVPASALEEISFKRDNIGADITEAKLRFAIFLIDGD